jgi:lipopolysaccharide export system permease protein
MISLRIKRADRLVGMSVLGTLVIVWLILVGFDALLQFGKQLGKLDKNGFTATQAGIYIMLTVPRRLYEFFGNAALIGGLLGLGGLASSGELTALRAAGMSKLRIAMSVTGVIAVLTLGVVILGETLAPVGDQHAQAMMLRFKSSSLGMTTDSGLWARDGKNVINAKNSRLVTPTDGLPGLQLDDVRVIHLTDDGQITQFDHARLALHDGRKWSLQDVRITTLDATGTHSRTEKVIPWDTKLDAHVLEQSVIQVDNLSMKDLRQNIRYMDANGQNSGTFAVAFWGRALYPLNVLVLVLCAMPFAFGALRSGGLGKRIFVGMLFAIGWYFFQKAVVSFGTVYGVPPIMANLAPTVMLALGASLYFRRHG